jgi:hypothetical protein
MVLRNAPSVRLEEVKAATGAALAVPSEPKTMEIPAGV